MAADTSALLVKQILAEYLHALTPLTDSQTVNMIQRVLHLLSSARHRGATIYVAGNGGSAATASHWVNDLCKATKKSPGLPPMRVIGLNDNVSWLTALANDEGYERVFSGQLENFARAGDLLIVISASGSSPNLVRAVEMAAERGVTTIAFLGFDGGVLKNKVDAYLWLPTERGAYGVVESAHSLFCHVLTECLVRDSVAGSDAEEKEVVYPS
jgi:D-sedoheptulose 7-phosphate isomerase